MMNADFLDALGQIEKEKDIPRDALLEMIASALSSAYKKTYNETARIRLRPDQSLFCMHPAPGRPTLRARRATSRRRPSLHRCLR